MSMTSLLPLPEDQASRVHVQVGGQAAGQVVAGGVGVAVDVAGGLGIASSTAGSGPSGFSLLASLITVSRPSSRCTSSMGLPGRVGPGGADAGAEEALEVHRLPLVRGAVAARSRSASLQRVAQGLHLRRRQPAEIPGRSWPSSTGPTAMRCSDRTLLPDGREHAPDLPLAPLVQFDRSSAASSAAPARSRQGTHRPAVQLDAAPGERRAPSARAQRLVQLHLVGLPDARRRTAAGPGSGRRRRSKGATRWCRRQGGRRARSARAGRPRSR